MRSAPALGSGAEPALYVHGLGGSAANWTVLMALMGGHTIATEPRPGVSTMNPIPPPVGHDAGADPSAVSQDPPGPGARRGDRRGPAVLLDGHAVDLPGCGLSPPPPDRKYTISAYARAVTRLIEQSGRGPVHLFGNSLGGAVCIRLAARRPDLVRTLTLISPALPDLRPRASTLLFPVLVAPALASLLLRRAQLFAAHTAAQMAAQTRATSIVGLIRSDPRRGHPRRRAGKTGEPQGTGTLNHTGEVLIRSVGAVMREYFRRGPGSLWHDAGQVDAPVLAIFGSHDALVDHRIARRIGRGFRNGRAVVLMRTGHVAQLEAPHAVAREVRAFLRECGGHQATPPATRTIGSRPAQGQWSTWRNPGT